jgi:hypothetical protein
MPHAVADEISDAELNESHKQKLRFRGRPGNTRSDAAGPFNLRTALRPKSLTLTGECRPARTVLARVSDCVWIRRETRFRLECETRRQFPLQIQSLRCDH